jgi:hypothetical protein
MPSWWFISISSNRIGRYDRDYREITCVTRILGPATPLHQDQSRELGLASGTQSISNVRLSVLDTTSRVHLDMSAGNARVALSAVTLALPEPIAIVSRLPRTAPRSIHADDRYRASAIGRPYAIGIPHGNNIIMAGWRCLKREEATGKWTTCSTCPNNLKSSSSLRRYRRASLFSRESVVTPQV